MTTKELIPGLEGVPAARSAISFIDGKNGVLEYRGYNIFDLANHCTFEEVAWLVIYGELPTRSQLEAFDAKLRAHRALLWPVEETFKASPASGHPMKALQMAMAQMGMIHRIDDVTDPAVQDEATARLVASMPTVVAAFHRLRNGYAPVSPRGDLGHAANFLYMLLGEEPDEVVAHTMDVALILHMEHTMNASTFTARVVGSTMADPYSVVSSALGSLSGPLHGGANERALRELRKIPSLDAVTEVIEAKIERKEKIMGLGHRVYKTKDPRAKILQGLAEKMLERTGGRALYDIARKVEDVATAKLGHKGIYPNVDFYSGIVYDAMGIPSDLFTPIFAIARVVGWLAHWREQLEGNRIFRPTQIYVGQRGREFTPMERRG